MSELQEALTAAGVTALVAKQIDPLLLEYQRRYSPLVRALPSTKWGSTTYFFNTRTSRVPGGFVTDGGARPVGTSVYVQSQFQIRNMQSVGAVTGYAQEVTRQVIGDLRAREISGAVQSLLWDIEAAICWGNDPSTQFGPYPMFSGLDTQVNAFAANPGANIAQNAVDAGGTALATRNLDQIIDLVETNAAAPVEGAEWMFVMSPTANSKIAQILAAQQRFDRVEVATGLVVMSYRDVPIVKSSFLGARGMAMTPVATTPSAAGGALAAGGYSYRVSAVIARLGEIVASASVPATVAGTGTGSCTLTFTPPTGFEGAPPVLYKVFRGTAAGTESLLGVVDANVGLAGDGITPIVATSIVDTGASLVPQNGVAIPAQSPAAYVGTNAGSLPRGSGLEDIFLISRNRDNVVRPYVRDITPVDVYPTTASPDSLPFALVSDTSLAVRAPKFAARLRNLSAAL